MNLPAEQVERVRMAGLIHDVGKPYFADGSFFYKADPADLQAFLEEYLASSPLGMDGCAAFLLRDNLYESVPA